MTIFNVDKVICMRNYLLDFFEQFEYHKHDATELMTAYDKIIANGDAKAILSGTICAYKENNSIDFNNIILPANKKISELACLNHYTVDLLVYICLTKHLKELYIEKNIDLQIYHDSVLDLKWKLEECKAVKGVCGVFVAYWFVNFFNLTRFALGRLQFEPFNVTFDYEKNGIKLEKDKSVALNVHIPRTGTPIDKQSCDNSYALAKEFFKKHLGESPVFVCFSWLLHPQIEIIAPKHTNVYRFFKEYDVVYSKDNDGEDLWRLFDTDEKDPYKLPTDSSLRRCFVNHLKNGGKVGEGFGIKRP